VESLSNTRSSSTRSKISLLFAFSRRRKRPAFDVRFLAVCGKINVHTIAAQKYTTPQAA
jgi:hypothetical protein